MNIANIRGTRVELGFLKSSKSPKEWKKLILAKASKTQIEIQAIGDGMIHIKDDALIKVILGEVSLEEVLQVL